MKTKDQLVKLGLSGRQADAVMLLESKMLEQAVKFQYRKKDGTPRDAVGTLDPEKMIMPNGEKWTPKGAAKPLAEEWMRYWDLGAQDWRQFNVLNLASVEG